MLRKFIAYLALATFATVLAQTDQGDVIKNLMRENKVSLEEALLTLDMGDAEAAEALGYKHWLFMEQEADKLTYLWADCVYPSVHTQGSVAETSESMVQIYFEETLSRQLPELPQCESDYKGVVFFVRIRLWTVGDDFPVAYHADIVTEFQDIRDSDVRRKLEAEPFATSYLGNASSTNFNEPIIELVDEVVADLALNYLRYTR